MDEKSLRRSPQQARSQKRVDEILEAASELLVEVGYEQLSTSAIAKRAGISVGSLYQFFANKDAVIQALGQRYLDEMAEMRAAMFTADSIYAPIPVLIERTVDLFVTFVGRHKGFHHIYTSPWVSSELKSVADVMNAQIVIEIERILAGKSPHLPESERHVIAQVMMYVIKGMLPLLETAVSDERAQIIEEFKKVGIAYMTEVIEGGLNGRVGDSGK